MSKLFEVILIETINICTRKCWFCKFGQERQDEKITRMEWETIERIIFNLKELNYKGRISWYGINEPLTEKRIYDILKLTKKHCPDAFLTFITNGDLLNQTVYRNLRKSGLDAIGVSIYDDKNLNKIHAMKKDNRLVIIDMRNPSGDKLCNRGGNIKRNAELFENKKSLFTDKSCERPFSTMVINPKAEVVLCCVDMYSDVVMGNVKQERLEDIWNNKIFNHYRKTLNEAGRNKLKLCNNCSHHGGGTTIYYPLQAKPKPVYLEIADRFINLMKKF